MGIAKLPIMKVLSAYMLAVTAGKDKPTVQNIKDICSAVGIELSEAEHSAAEEIIEEMACKDIAEVLADGLKTIKDVPLGGGGGAPAAGGAAAPAGGAAAAAAPGEESEEEEDAGPVGGGLFGDGGGDD